MAADKDEIKDRTDIVDLIQSYVPLKRRGANFVGLCPFHAEKTGSFNVLPSMRTFNCFGCGAKGDVFTFVERYENMSFLEAAEFLARRAGLKFEPHGSHDPTKPSDRERLLEVNALSVDWFRRQLEQSELAQGYLQQRGIATESIQKFRLGYAPERWDALTSFFRQQRIDLRVAEKAGMVKMGSSGDYFDMFRHRVIFPIQDEQDRVVGFGGRAFGDDQPKYLNTSETPLFTKSKLLYGLPLARRKIASEGQTLLMEGYMDVIAAHQAGFANAVATLGTSLTEHHAAKLARLVPENPRVVLVYDGDNAGIKATLRASEILEKEAIEVRVTRLPHGEDPDSLLKDGHIDKFQHIIDTAVGRVEYQLDRIITLADQSSDAGKAKMLSQIVYILGTVATRTERDIYVERVWRFHPLSSQGPGIAKEHLHKDAESVHIKIRAKAPSNSAASPNAYSTRTEVTANSHPVQPKYRTSGGDKKPWKPWDGPREAFRPIIPPPSPTGLAADELAERAVLRAITTSEWRDRVLTTSGIDDLLSPFALQMVNWVRRNTEKFQDDDEKLIRLLESCDDSNFSSAALDLLQEFQVMPTNEPLTDAVWENYVRQLEMRKLRQTKVELESILQNRVASGTSGLTSEDKDRIQHLSQLIRDLQSGSHGQKATTHD